MRRARRRFHLAERPAAAGRLQSRYIFGRDRARALRAAQLHVDAEELPHLAATFFRELPVDDLPYLVEHVHEHVKERDPEDEGAFVFGLDLILDGLEKIRDTA